MNKILISYIFNLSLFHKIIYYKLFTKGTHLLNINGKSYSKQQKLPPTSSCSSLESIYSSSSAGYTSKSTLNSVSFFFLLLHL